MAIEDEVVRRCTERGITVSVAESCTGGLIGSLIVDVPGSSKVFVGGIIAYHNGPKQKLLNVPEALLTEHGAVSEPCVAAMAVGARAAFHTTVALAESGIAGPAGGSSARPAGTVYIGIADGEGAHVEHHVFPGSRRAYKLQVAETALRLLLDWLDRQPAISPPAAP